MTPVQLTGVKMQEYFETLLAQMEHSTVDSMVTTGLALHEMLALCARSILAQTEATSARQVILQAVETLRKNYQKELCLADLLAEAHMSKKLFSSPVSGGIWARRRITIWSTSASPRQRNCLSSPTTASARLHRR